MNFEQLGVLLPCQTLDALDLQRSDEDAAELLSAWSVLWHPLLLKSAGRLPRWVDSQSVVAEPAARLVILPSCCEASLAENWGSEAEAAGACILRALSDRDEMLAAALSRAELDTTAVDADLAADFLALGYCHMQIELLSRKLNYTINLDETALQSVVLAAADEAISGNLTAARERLQTAFDRLHDAREYTYQTETRLLDLVLVAHSTLGPALRAELAGTGPCNIQISGELVEELASREPETLESLKQALAANRCAIIGGEYAELPLPLLDLEALAHQFERGLAAYREHLQSRPAIFGRRRFGLTPVLPQVLIRNEFVGAIHCTLDDGQFPVSRQSRLQWEGLDGAVIEAIGCVPLDAGRAGTFFRLAETLGNAMSLDHTATIAFAHWPGRVSPWFDDVRRVAAYGSIFGAFLTVNDYFDQTKLAGQRQNYRPDEYRSPYLKQDAAGGGRDPISRWVRYFHRRALLDGSQALHALSAMCRPAEDDKDKNEPIDLEQSLSTNDEPGGELDRRLGQDLAGFAAAITASTASPDRGTLSINPWSFSQFASDPPSSATDPLEVPAMGFAWVNSKSEPLPATPKRRGWFGSHKAKRPPSLADKNLLRNEFCEVHFDPSSGAIRAISDYRSRDPRLAQQIALRVPQGSDPAADANYTVMAADAVEITSAGPTLGEMVSRGRLLTHDGRAVAAFRQTTRLRRGSRVIELQIELDVDQQPGPNPWESYYAARFAWKDEASKLHRSVSMGSVPTELTQFESPHFLDIVRDDRHTTLLFGGLPYHRRIGPRKLDTLLIPRGETGRSFRLGIGIDVPSPMSAALGFVAPPLVLANQPRPPTTTGWLFHFDCLNVLATHWEPLENDDATQDNSRGLTAPGAAAEKNCAGFRVRLLETEGRGVRLGLRSFRAVLSARKINPGDVPAMELQVEGDRINIPIGPHQWIEVEARFT